MRFSAGDPVVAAGCGVGVVEDVESVDADGQGVFMYRLWFPTNKMRMWVPVSRAAADGVRAPMSADEAEEVLSVVQNHPAPEQRTNWNRRQRRYRELLMSNEPRRMAELLGELAAVRRIKSLSFGERTLFETVRDLLAAELELASNAHLRLQSILQPA